MLIVDRPPSGPTEAIAFIGRSGPYVPVPAAQLAEAVRNKEARRILLIEDRSARTVRAGVVPTLESLVRDELKKRDLLPEALTMVVLDNPVGWDGIRRLGDWLSENPGAAATLLVGEFESRLVERIARSTMPEDAYRRTRIHPLPDSRHGADDWWKSRQGVLHVLGNFVGLAHLAVCGEPDVPARRWDVDRFEADLRQTANR